MLPAILVAPLVKFAGTLLSHADPKVRKEAWDLYMTKRQQKTKDSAKLLVDHFRNLNEVLNKLVRKADFKKLLAKLGKDESSKFYSMKNKARAQAEKLFKLL